VLEVDAGVVGRQYLLTIGAGGGHGVGAAQRKPDAVAQQGLAPAVGVVNRYGPRFERAAPLRMPTTGAAVGA